MLKKAAVAAKNGKTPTYYMLNGQKRKIQVNQCSTSDLTNMDRLRVGKFYKNSHKTVEGNEVYTNKTAIMKVTAYLIYQDNEPILSNSVYACLNNVGNTDLAVDAGTITTTQGTNYIDNEPKA